MTNADDKKPDLPEAYVRSEDFHALERRSAILVNDMEDLKRRGLTPTGRVDRGIQDLVRSAHRHRDFRPRSGVVLLLVAALGDLGKKDPFVFDTETLPPYPESDVKAVLALNRQEARSSVELGEKMHAALEEHMIGLTEIRPFDPYAMDAILRSPAPLCEPHIEKPPQAFKKGSFFPAQCSTGAKYNRPQRKFQKPRRRCR